MVRIMPNANSNLEVNSSVERFLSDKKLDNKLNVEQMKSVKNSKLNKLMDELKIPRKSRGQVYLYVLGIAALSTTLDKEYSSLVSHSDAKFYPQLAIKNATKNTTYFAKEIGAIRKLLEFAFYEGNGKTYSKDDVITEDFLKGCEPYTLANVLNACKIIESGELTKVNCAEHDLMITFKQIKYASAINKHANTLSAIGINYKSEMGKLLNQAKANIELGKTK